MWQGMMFFGLNTEGYIDVLIFDRKVPTLRPAPKPQDYPWFEQAAQHTRWSPDLVQAHIRTSVVKKEVSRRKGGEDNVLQ